MRAFDLSPIILNFYRGIFENDDRPNWEAYVLLLAPLAISVAAFDSQITESIISTMTTALAILFGFTFSSLLTTAQYSDRGDNLEKQLIEQTRTGTSYALLMNLLSLISVVCVSIFIVDFDTVSSTSLSLISVFVYYFLFHYLLVMVYLMRYLYLLATGGAFEQNKDMSESKATEQERSTEITIEN